MKYFIKLVSMFKKLLFLLSFKLLLFSSKAQDSTDFILTEVKVFSNNSFNLANQYKNLFGYGFSVGLDFKSKSIFQLKAGVGYLNSLRYVDSMAVRFGYYYNTKYKHDWLIFNLNMKIFMDKQKHFYFETGINIDVLLHTKSYGNQHITSQSLWGGNQTRDYYYEDVVEAFGVNIVLPMEIGYKIPINNTFLMVFINYNLGLSHLKEFVYSEEFLFKNSYFNSGIGLSF